MYLIMQMQYKRVQRIKRCGKMCRTAVQFVLTVVLVIFITGAASSDNVIEKSAKKPVLRISDPVIWTEVDYKPIVDNDRLFKKYKDCVIAENGFGCPRIVTEFKKLIPEIIETMCAKCLPVHIEKFKEAVTYICHKRRADYDEVRQLKDPDGAIQAEFETKYGKLDC